MPIEQDKDDIEEALRLIDEDYIECFKKIRKIYDYLETFGLKDFNRYSKFKWSYDREKLKGYGYVSIRYGSSISKQCVVKRRALIEDADLYKWVKYKDLIQEAVDEAYEYILAKVSTVKDKMEGLRKIVDEYNEKIDELSDDYDEAKKTGKGLRSDVNNLWKEEVQEKP